ncbi:MAG TPA: NBR1-Ig-like domain-containing protein [Anaerolineales bacterium]|nr:NBR1-Ig-like domain-containing protein [Anaerolineales bacterium]
MNHTKRVFLGLTLLVTILLSACGSSSSANGTDTLSAIYTSAAQTVVAQDTADMQSAIDQNATITPMDEASDTPAPTGSPTLFYSLPTSTPYDAVATPGGSTCDGASYISDVTVPDGTVEVAGQPFIKTWMFQNTGSCTWDANYALTFTSGDQMGGTTTSIGGSVAPGQQAELSVTLTAPTTAGQYTGYWRLANDSGEEFGVTVYVLIDVTEDATATYEDTAFPAATATYTPVSNTATAVPTVAPTTPVPTAVPTTAVPTAVPTTAVPTSAPTTAVPTSIPTTAVPTSIPTTAVPTTAATSTTPGP